MKLTVLGCSGSYPAPGVPCSGYLVQSDHTTVVIDLGHGTFPALDGLVDLTTLDAIVLTHAHPDHWVDLTALRIVTHYQLGHDHIPVWGTDETRDMVATVCGSIEPAFTWHRLGPDATFGIGDLTFTIERTDHYVETYAVRVDGPDGTSLAYSSDTGPGWSIAGLAAGVDVAVVESSYATVTELGDVLHLSAGQAGEMATAAEAGALLLTHLVPGADAEAHRRAARATYGGPVDLATPGLVVDL